MTETRRNVLVLVSFVVCLGTVSAYYAIRELRPESDRDYGSVLGTRTDPRDLPPITPPKLENPYRQIADRNLFRPLAKEPEQPAAETAGGSRGASRPSAGSGGAWVPPDAGLFVPPAGPAPWTGETTQPLATEPPRPPSPRIEPPDTPAPEVGTGPAPATVAITGVGGSGGDLRVLVEDNATGQSRWVKPGGTAFGYRVDYVTGHGGVVSKDGRSYVLGVGENKPPAKPPAEKSEPASKPPAATEGAGGEAR